jgi:penicillin-binding protein 2
LETDITGLRSGLIPDPTYYDKWYGHHRWAFSTIRSISIGQGEVMLTPLHLANVAALIANRGWYISPHFVMSIGQSGPAANYRKRHFTMVDRKHYGVVVEGMRRVVHISGGTGKRAKLKDIIVCGKTGTVQNPHGEDHSVFIAFAPKDDPKIAIAVYVENAGWGGRAAASTASLMIEHYIKGQITRPALEEYVLAGKFTN